MEIIDHTVVLTDEEKERCKEDWWFKMQVAFRQISEDCIARRPFMRIGALKNVECKSGLVEPVASWPIAKNTFRILFSSRCTVLCLDEGCFAKQINEGRERRKRLAQKIKKRLSLIDKQTNGAYKINELIKEDLVKMINTE